MPRTRGFNNYVKSFAALVQAEVRLGLNEKLGLSGSLRAAVHDIETKLKERDDPRLTSSMLTMRRHEKDFMLRRDPKYVGELKKTGRGIRKARWQAPISAGAEGGYHPEAGKVSGGFSAWAEGAQQVARHGAAM